LLGSLCLRRNKKYLNLAEPLTEDISVELSAEERQLYNDILTDCGDKLDDIISGKGRIKKYSVLFTAMLQLRRLCNQGSFSSGSTPSLLPYNAPQLGLEATCELCSDADGDNVALIDEANVCPECFRPLKSPPRNSRYSIPSGSNPPGPSALRGSFALSPKSGVSTKLSAVVENVVKHANTCKSLVFSSCTTTLDILHQLLKSSNIKSLVIDGRVSYNDRLRILQQFREDQDLPVLLMSIGTGAVGSVNRISLQTATLSATMVTIS
jgi:SWI/SNF-related matrix-associated actin-dependent regulator of chromatin subfamily A3